MNNCVVGLKSWNKNAISWKSKSSKTAKKRRKTLKKLNNKNQLIDVWKI